MSSLHALVYIRRCSTYYAIYFTHFVLILTFLWNFEILFVSIFFLFSLLIIFLFFIYYFQQCVFIFTSDFFSFDMYGRVSVLKNINEIDVT